MIPYTPTTIETAVDLRSPVGSTLRKGTVIKWIRFSTLVCFDVISLIFSWYAAERLGAPTTSFWQAETNPYSMIPIVSIIVSMVASQGLYSSGDRRRDYIGLLKAVALGALFFLLAAYFYQPQNFVSRSHFTIFFVLSLATTCLSHLTIDTATKILRKKGAIRYPAYVIADPEQVSQTRRLIDQENRYNILGISSARALDRYERAATFAKLKSMGITEAFVTWDAIKRRLFLSWHFQSHGITLRVIPLTNEPVFRGASLWMIGGMAALSFSPTVITGIEFRLKRILDFCCTLFLLVLASPLYLLIMLLIRLDSPGPIFYKQTRIGLHGKPFEAWKFRSMIVNADQLQKDLEALNKNQDGILFKIENDPRITKVGRFLRSHSLDELPQMFNVLLGEMSLVGPRPLPVRDVEKFSERHFIRHEVLPGITGLWQVSGRSDIDDFERVIMLDLLYIENWSLWLDFTILLRTIGVVLKKSGAY